MTALQTAIILWAGLQTPETGAIKGRVSPEVPIRVVAKLAGKDASVKENVKGEAMLPKGGEFAIEKLPPGKYDLVFQIQGDQAKKFIASAWSEITIEAGKTVEGIRYRLTPADARQEVDAICVLFASSLSDAECMKAVESLGCRVKHRSPAVRGSYVVDIPDEKEVPEMVKAFKALKGVEVAEPNFIRRIP